MADQNAWDWFWGGTADNLRAVSDTTVGIVSEFPMWTWPGLDKLGIEYHEAPARSSLDDAADLIPGGGDVRIAERVGVSLLGPIIDAGERFFGHGAEEVAAGSVKFWDRPSVRAAEVGGGIGLGAWGIGTLGGMGLENLTDSTKKAADDVTQAAKSLILPAVVVLGAFLLLSRRK